MDIILTKVNIHHGIHLQFVQEIAHGIQLKKMENVLNAQMVVYLVNLIKKIHHY